MALSIVTPFSVASVASVAEVASAPPRRGLVELDARVASGAPGVVVVRVRAGEQGALVEHLGRRIAQSGLSPCLCTGGPGAPAFHLAAQALQVAKAADPQMLAEELLAAATRSARKVVLVAPLPVEGGWDHAVMAELVAAPRAALLVFVAERPRTELPASRELGLIPSADSVDAFELDEPLREAERQHYLATALDGLSVERSLDSMSALSTLTARLSVPGENVPSPRARELLANLTLVALPWPLASVAELGDLAHVDELRAAGLVACHDGRISVLRATEPHGADGLDGTRAARALLTVFEGDGWAEGRAAELLLDSDPDLADATHERALERLPDPVARRELRRRWMQAARHRHSLLLRASHRALEAGEAEEALRCTEACAPSSGESAEFCLLTGRALVGLGDLVGGKVAFERARERDADGALTARIAVELAEVAYAQGAFDRARTEAELAKNAACPAPGADVRSGLRASNVLGKIRLAEGKWDEADAHFAEDAMVAGAAGLVTEGLRARLNRAIAVQSKGLLDEANAMLRALLEDAEAAADQRACAYALTNLAVVAWTRHDYGMALECLERTFAMRRALGSPATISHTVASLAELRLRLGLYEHARHTITFGRRAGMTAATASQFAVVAARIALARGDTLTARREVESAIADATTANDGEWLGEAHRVAARIALEEGDVTGCTLQLSKAAPLGKTDRACAEQALLEAQARRAAGAPNLSLAELALRHGRASGDEEILCEILYLLALLHRDSGDETSARAFCSQAVTIRDRVAQGLREDVRSAFLGKPEGLALGRLALSLAPVAPFAPFGPFPTRESSPCDPDLHEAPRTERSPRARSDENRRELVGDDPQIRALVSSIKKVGRSGATVLIRGESGTGKELVAEALHRASDRVNGPLVTVNCAALVETLLLSELFGHEKGAFTGATTRRRGRFELAEGGTLFLDEIGDISSRTQVALLRVLQEKTFERVGGTSSVRANVRIICATHRDLRAMVDRGEFREDLYYRLQGIQLEVPALRARLGDLGRIADALLARIAVERAEEPKRLRGEALELLRTHRWPGNVRELENALRAASLFAEGDSIGVSELVDNVEDLRTAAATWNASSKARASLLTTTPEPAPSGAAGLGSVSDDDELGGAGPLPTDEANATAIAYEQVRQGAVSLSDMKRQIERDCIARALSDTKGNITKAATLLGMKRPRLSQLVKQYGLTATSTEGV